MQTDRDIEASTSKLDKSIQENSYERFKISVETSRMERDQKGVVSLGNSSSNSSNSSNSSKSNTRASVSHEDGTVDSIVDCGLTAGICWIVTIPNY